MYPIVSCAVCACSKQSYNTFNIHSVSYDTVIEDVASQLLTGGTVPIQYNYYIFLHLIVMNIFAKI